MKIGCKLKQKHRKKCGFTFTEENKGENTLIGYNLEAVELEHRDRNGTKK